MAVPNFRSGTTGQVTGARYRPEDKGRNDIRRLKSVLPNLKLVGAVRGVSRNLC